MSCSLSPLFSEGMVLQRKHPVTIWGRADKEISVSIQGQHKQARPDADGRFSLTLDPLHAGGPYEMTVGELVFHEVYVGDVWLLGGQSNMELPLRRVRFMFPEEIAKPCPHIRAFIVPQEYDFHAGREDVSGGFWRGAAAETVEDFSAAGYFFAKRVWESQQVPVGLLMSAVGGTPIHAWMGRDCLEDDPAALAEAERCADDAYVAQVQATDAENAARYRQNLHEQDPGLSERWFDPLYDDGAWEERDLLTPWEGCGTVWWRKTLDIPAAMSGKAATLFLGTVIDADEVYLNGVCIGDTGYRYPPRVYDIPALPSGSVNITVRVTAGHGGCFTKGKQYLLSSTAGSLDLQGLWRFRKAARGEPCPPDTTFKYKPTGLYNGMIHPLRRWAIRGALWYQGESDGGNPSPYADRFAKMIRRWRADWGRDFPVITVELAHWGDADWEALRRKQREALRLPNTAMAAAFDLGEHNDLHPQDKRTVGERLARCALRLAYGESLPPSPFEVILAE